MSTQKLPEISKLQLPFTERRKLLHNDSLKTHQYSVEIIVANKCCSNKQGGR
jgi:hypothetical protein